ncbi:MAG: hypothetical protein Q9167_004515 [Letrouitia subvulpina]
MPPKKAHAKRPLPNARNPLLAPSLTPEFDELVKQRRLGQTNLSVKVAQVGTSNATKPENLGPFDYAHLKVPLPTDFKGSDVLPVHHHQPVPTAYFLMRRSSDGYVSASGMFKAAFPWATHHEEKVEKDYLKGLPTTAEDEVAGNIWIPETYGALDADTLLHPIELASEYDMATWVAALIDGAVISKGSDDRTNSISPPPKYTLTMNDKTHLPPPTSRASTPARSRGRPRASSPTKSETQGSPRKKRGAKETKAQSAKTAKEVSATLQDTLETAASVADAESVDGEKVKVEVDTAVQVNGETETTTTNVKVEMPAGSAQLPLPEDPDEMVRQARKMVEEANKLEGNSSKSVKKRKAQALEEEESDEEADRQLQPAKKARLAEQELKKERVRNRALIGVAATVAIG